MPRIHKASRHLCSFLKNVCVCVICMYVVCTFVCVRACVCLRIGLCMPRLTCGCQGTLMGGIPRHPIFVRQSLLHWVMARLAGPKVPGFLLSLPLTVLQMHWDCRRSLPYRLCHECWGPRLRSLGSRGNCFTHWTLSPAPDLCSSQ